MTCEFKSSLSFKPSIMSYVKCEYIFNYFGSYFSDDTDRILIIEVEHVVLVSLFCTSKMMQNPSDGPHLSLHCMY